MNTAQPRCEDAPADWATGRGLLVSLLIHALLIAPWVLHELWLPAPPPTQQLAIELFGDIANRQTEQQNQGQRVASATPPAPKPAAAPHKQIKALTQSLADSPVQVAKEEAPQDRTPSTPSAPPTQGAEEQQRQQTLRNDTPVDVMRRYLAGLKKQVKAQIVYPSDARQAGLTGAPEVAFSIGADGQLVAGSLTVRKSSGHPQLDEAALRAVRAAAPFSPPPFPMSPKLEIPFEEDRKG